MKLRSTLPAIARRIKESEDKLSVSEDAVSVTIQTAKRQKKGKDQPRTSVSFTVNDTTPQELADFITKAIENA